jgi:DNA-binding NarL/FixJ family response regulator
VLAVEDDIRVVAQPGSPEHLVNAAARLRSHVTLLSSAFVPVLPQVQPIAAKQQTALLLVAENGEDASQYTQLGFQGVVFRSVASTTMVRVVRRLAQGESFVQHPDLGLSDISADPVETSVSKHLCPTELCIIRGVVRGYRNREIAQQIRSSEKLVKNTLRAILDKLGVSDRLELVLYVLHHRVVEAATTVTTGDSGLGLVSTNTTLCGTLPPSPFLTN